MTTSYTEETEGGNRTHNHTEPVSLCPEDAISEALLHAVDYNERGWAVVPLLPGRTNPANHGGRSNWQPPTSPRPSTPTTAATSDWSSESRLEVL